MIRAWKVMQERQTRKKIKAFHTDNAPELKEVLDSLVQSDGIVAEYITIATSSQNGTAERAI